MSIKEQRASNELHIKITWVLELDSSETEFQLSIFMVTYMFLV